MVSEKIVKVVVDKILGLKKGEKFLVVTDKVKEKLAREFYDYGEEITESELIVMEPLKMHGEEPLPEVGAKMLCSEVLFLLTDKSLSHTSAVRKAIAKGARGISSPNMFEDILERCVDIDYTELEEVHEWLREILVGSEEIRVMTDLGTEVKFSVSEVHGYPEHLLKRKKGAFGNLPTGEVDSGVKRVEGKIVIDGSLPFLGLLNEEIVLEVVGGFAKIVSENKSSLKLKKILDEVGEEAYKIAEFGIGTNPAAKVTGRVIEDEKVRGTVHFALGNDLSYGGSNDVPLHLDGVVREPTILVDGQMVMEKGKFLI